MEKHHQAFRNSLPLEPDLTDMILKPKSEKIRRPPNAFMLFARDHRRLIAVQHPNVCNKTVSTMLGKVWKSTPESVKSKYYKKAKMLGELHKRHYPNYVYSPREARIQKMNKKKRNKEETNYGDSLQQKEEMRDETQKSKDDDNLNQEGCTMTAMDPDPDSGPVYVPNNPGYFSEHSSNMNSDDEPEYDEQPHQSVCPADFQYQSEPLHREWDQDDKNRRWQTPPPGICRCCDRSKYGCQEKHIPPYHRQESERTGQYHPDSIPRSYVPPPTFCNSSGPFSRPMSPYCCSPPPGSSPRPYVPPYHPYWNLSSMNCPSREHIYENLKPYPTSYYTPDCFAHPFGYLDRHAAQFNPNPSCKLCPPSNRKEDLCEREQHISQKPDSNPGFSRYANKGNSYCHSQVRNSTVDDEMALHNERIVKSNIGNFEEMRNRYQDCGCGIRIRGLDNTGPVTEDGMYLKDDHGGSHLQHEKKNKISADTFVPREEFQPSVSDKIDGENEAIFADFRNFKSQAQSQEASNFVEFSESDRNRDSRASVRFEEASNLPETNSHRNNFENMYAADISSRHPSFSGSSKIPSWSAQVMKSDLPVNITKEECDRSLTKMDDRSMSGSLQNNIFSPNKLSMDSMRSNYNGHNQNDLENTEYNHSMEVQLNRTTESYSDLRQYQTQINQQISNKEVITNFPVSFVEIEEDSTDVFEEYTENLSKSSNEVCNVMEKARIFSSKEIQDVH